MAKATPGRKQELKNRLRLNTMRLRQLTAFAADIGAAAVAVEVNEAIRRLVLALENYSPEDRFK